MRNTRGHLRTWNTHMRASDEEGRCKTAGYLSADVRDGITEESERAKWGGRGGGREKMRGEKNTGDEGEETPEGEPAAPGDVRRLRVSLRTGV